MSHCIVPNWNSRHHQRQDQEIQVGEERNSNRSHQSHQNLSTYVIPMSNNYEVGEEVTWESGEQPAVALMHGGHGGIIGTGLTPQTKPLTWSRSGDTLESIVHQATFSNSNNTTSQQHEQDRERVLKYSTSILMPPSSCENWRENTISTASQQMQVETNDEYNGIKMRSINYMPSMSYSCGGLRINSMGTEGINRVEKSGLDVVIKKRVRSDNCGKNSFNDQVEERTSCADAGAGASANNITDTTMMSTWTSFESSPSPTFKRTATINTHHHSHSRHCSENQDDENKGESLRSQSSIRRSHAAVVHNQSERRRRDRINEKLMALQKLVPNASKTDKASMLDEVIEYLKQLQAQVNMLSNARTIPQMVMPLGMQEQLQMSILGRMGMGMGMLDHVNMNFPRNMSQSLPPLLHGTLPPLGTTTSPSFLPPPFTIPSLVPPLISTPLKPNIDSTNITSTTPIPNFTGAYGTFLAQQSMNMDFFNKMAALYRQQANQPSKKPNTLSHPNNVRGDQ